SRSTTVTIWKTIGSIPAPAERPSAWATSWPKSTTAQSGRWRLARSNLFRNLHAQLQKFGGIGVGFCLGVDAEEGFSAGSSQHEPGTILGQKLHSVVGLDLSER